MKGTLVTFVFAGFVSTAAAWEVNGTFSWPDTGSDTLVYTEVNEVEEIAITDVYSNVGYKEVKYWDAAAADGAGALTAGWVGYTPDVNVGNGGSWTLSFTVTNTHGEDTMTLESITLQAVEYDSAGKFQPNSTDRNITFTLGGAAAGATTATLKGKGENSDSGRTENVTSVTIELEQALEIAANDSVVLTLTASPKLNDQGGNAAGGGTFVGLKGATFSLIPEPTTATLSLLALAGMAARRRRH